VRARACVRACVRANLRANLRANVCAKVCGVGVDVARPRLIATADASHLRRRAEPRCTPGCTHAAGYSMPEVEHVFGTRSSDSVFWPIFSTFHTLLPHQIDEPSADDSLDDFLAP
jgi:hypothetical protein